MVWDGIYIYIHTTSLVSKYIQVHFIKESGRPGNTLGTPNVLLEVGPAFSKWLDGLGAWVRAERTHGMGTFPTTICSIAFYNLQFIYSSL